jgi:RNA polymerase sigma factor (sigma-70 family)
MADEKLPDGWELIVKRIAREVARRRFPKTQLAQDLCDNAAGHVWERRNSYDPGKAPFEAWCFTVIRNLATDLLRSLRLRGHVDGRTGKFVSDSEAEIPCPEDFEDRSAHLQLEHIQYQLDHRTAFCKQDLAALEELPAQRRVIALAVADLQAKVPPDLWEQWLADANLEPPFPSADLSESANLIDRCQQIADELSMSLEAVRQHWYRALNTIRSLKYVRE